MKTILMVITLLLSLGLWAQADVGERNEDCVVINQLSRGNNLDVNYDLDIESKERDSVSTEEI